MNKDMCVCQQNSVLVIERRMVSRVIAILVALCFFIFIAGYFFGKKQAIAQFSEKLAQESFADQIYSSLDSLYDGYLQEQTLAENDAQETDASQDAQEIMAAVQQQTQKPETGEPKKMYIALLSGFGSKKTGQEFVEKLSRKGISVALEEKVSYSKQHNKQITWYQAVTPRFADKNELTALVTKLKNEERLGNNIEIKEVVA